MIRSVSVRITLVIITHCRLGDTARPLNQVHDNYPVRICCSILWSTHRSHATAAVSPYFSNSSQLFTTVYHSLTTDGKAWEIFYACLMERWVVLYLRHHPLYRPECVNREKVSKPDAACWAINVGSQAPKKKNVIYILIELMVNERKSLSRFKQSTYLNKMVLMRLPETKGILF